MGAMRPGWQQKPVEDRTATVRGLSERIEHLRGRRAALQERHDTLVRDVGLAKGRVAAKGEVEKFIQELQAEAYRKSTHSFETLLTAITQEVLPGAKPIALDLSTERGMPSLSISSLGQGDTREDIFEDHGGALSNVIGMGLRLIAVVKSGGQRFLGLDEPECWTKPDRVPAFFGVLEDAARRLGVQCLTITHHDGSANFSADVRIAKLVGEPTTGASIVSDMPPPVWTDDMVGFRYVRLKDFQAFPDTKMDLGPGINAIVGPNDHGKSGFIRALRAVFYGETRDTHIRHGAKQAIVEIGLAAGRYLKFTRVLRGSPKNVWSLHEKNGAVVVENGELRQTGGNEPPAWVDASFGIVRHDGHDIHISHQKFPVFLIDKPGSKRAAVLSFGQESGYTNDMLAIQKERLARDNAIIRDGEREIGELRAQLTAIEGVDALAERVEAARSLSEGIAARADRIAGMERVSDRLGRAIATQRRAWAVLKALSDLPSSDEVRRMERGAANLEQGTRLRARMTKAMSDGLRAKRTLNILSHLPEAAPQPLDLAPAENLIHRMRTAATRADTAGKRLIILSRLPDRVPELTAPASEALRGRQARALAAAEKAGQGVVSIDARIAEIKSEMELAIADGGGNCPTCGGRVDSETLFHEHAL